MAKLENILVKFISLVKKPANRRRLILKEDGVEGRIFDIRKTDDDLKRAYGIVYAPDDIDAQGDWAEEADIRKAADEFMKSGRLNMVDENHSFINTSAFVAESWIVRKGDPMFKIEKAGAWAVGIQVLDDRLWGDIKKGDYAGLSLAGTASHIQAPPAWYRKFFGTLKGENKMEKEQFEVLSKSISELAAAVGDMKVKQAEMTKQIADAGKQIADAGKKDDKQDQTKKQQDVLTKEDVMKMIDNASKEGWKEDVMKMIDNASKEGWKEVVKVLAESLQKGVGNSGQAKKSVFADMV